MGKGKPQQVIVTKQRKKTGTTGGCVNVVLIVCTGGLWLVVPLMQWLAHLLGPRQKSKTVVYGVAEQQQWQQPYYPAPQRPQYYAPPGPAPFGYDQYGRPLPGPTLGRVYGPPLPPPGQPAPPPQQWQPPYQ